MKPKRIHMVRARVDDDLYRRVAARAADTSLSAVVVTALELHDAVLRVLEGQRP